MRHLTNLTIIFAVACSASATLAQDAADKISRATKHINSKQKYDVKYKMAKGDVIHWAVEHVASTKAQIAGDKEESSSRTKSEKLWKVSSVDSRGNMTFVYSVESVNMWQQVGEGDPVTFDSKKDESTPAEFEGVDEKLGKPLAVITVAPNGVVMDRKTSIPQARFGVGEITIPLPKDPIAVGYKWYVPSQLTARDENGLTQTLKTRIHYQLSRVKGINAYISFRTEVLTPIESEKVKSQIMQQMTKGYIVFDLNRGLPVRKEVEWDEKVIGYEGPDSYLNYVGKLTEKLVINAARPLAPNVDRATSKNNRNRPSAKMNNILGSDRSANRIKPRNGKPVLRK